MHEIIFRIVDFVSGIIELLGTAIVAITILQGLYRMIFVYKMDFNAAHYDFSINAGLSNALEILLAAEVLKTIAYRTTDQLLEVAALVIIRIFLTLLIHWEYRQKADHDLREHPQDVEYEYTVVEEEEEV